MQVYGVEGMTCASCANQIRNAVKKLPGISTVKVNYASGTLMVDSESENTIDYETLSNTVKKAGYQIFILNKNILTEIDNSLKQLKKQKSLLLLTIVLTVPVVVISMAFMHRSWYIDLLLMLMTIIVMLTGGMTFYRQAFKQLLHLHAGMDTLVSLGTLSAFVFSCFNLLSHLTTEQLHYHVNVYFESVVVIICFVLAGRYFEHKARYNATSTMGHLLRLQAKNAHRLNADGIEEEIDIEKVVLSDILIVRAGEKIPVDGIIIQGASYIDESMITGEPLPNYKKENEPVTGGTICKDGYFTMKATSTGEDGILANIIRQVRESQSSKAPIQNYADRISAVFVPAILATSAITFLLWNFSGVENAFYKALINAINVLVIACPCALGLATPMAVMVATGKAALKGIVYKEAESIQMLSKANTIVFDKTGTLTKGKFEVSEIITEKDIDFHEYAGIIYGVEYLSSHPLSDAICQYLKNNLTIQVEIDTFEFIEGKGIKAKANDKQWYIGNLDFMVSNSQVLSAELKSATFSFEKKGMTVILVSCNGNTGMAIVLFDQIKEDAKETINYFKQNNYQLHMITGDSREAAGFVASHVGINNFRWRMLPSEKRQYIQTLVSQGKKVIMVGDGINDAPSLKEAHAGIALSNGTEAAIGAASVTIMGSKLFQICKAVNLAKMADKTMKINLFWAFCYNLISTPIAAGALWFVNGLTLNPMIAGVAMALSSVTVVANSLMLYYRKW